MIAWIRRNLPWEITLQITVWILAAMVLGLFDLYTFRFDPRRFMNSDYLIEVGVLIGLGLFIFALRLFLKLKVLIAEDTINEDLRNTMNGYVNGKNKLRHIVAFILYLNRMRRITAFVERTQEKIGTLLGKLTQEEQTEYSQYIEGSEVVSKRVKKLLKAQEQISEEYLEVNGSYVRAKFTRITPNYMTSGFNNSKSKSANQDPAKGFSTAFKDNVLNFTIPTVLVGFVIGSILVATEADVWAIILIVSIKLLLLLFQDWSANRYSPTYYGKTVVHDLHLRKTFWEQYFQWILDEKGGDE